MELHVDLWHLAFVNLIQHRAPPNFEVQSEVRLTIEPQRADIVLLRRLGAERQDHEARVLRSLWPRLGLVTILEYKSPPSTPRSARGTCCASWATACSTTRPTCPSCQSAKI